MLNISSRIKSPSFVPFVKEEKDLKESDLKDIKVKMVKETREMRKSKSFGSFDYKKDGTDDVDQEIQSIIFNTPMTKPLSGPRGGKFSPPLVLNGHNNNTKIYSPRFSPRLKNSNGFPMIREDNEEDDGLRTSTSEVFRAFSHSPSPYGNTTSVSEDESIGDLSSEEERVITPPLRTSNPIIFNSNFMKNEERKSVKKTVDIGLFSVSPSLEDVRNRFEQKLVFNPYVNTSQDQKPISEVESLFDLE